MPLPCTELMFFRRLWVVSTRRLHVGGLLLVFASVIVFSPLRLTSADDLKVADKAALKLSPKEQRALNGIARKLVSKPKSKDDPNDSKTWYVLLFIEAARGARQSVRDTAEYRITTLEIQSTQELDAKLVQGKEAAALAVAQFYVSANAAAAKLNPTQGGVTQGAELQGGKDWRFKSFVDEDQAKQFLESVQPKKPE